MDLQILKQEHAADPDFEKLVSHPRGVIPRREIKLALMALGKLEAVAVAVPLFVSDPDFADIDVLSPLTQGVFTSLKTNGVLTQADHDTLNALGTEMVPRWKALGFERMPDSADITKANE